MNAFRDFHGSLRPAEGLDCLQRRIELSQPIDTIFPFFADAFNLERITPPFLRFRVLTPAPIKMGVGTRIDYRIRVHGIPMRWQSEIIAWEPPHRFVDLQVRGPYRWWQHDHRFESTAYGTCVTDEVEYAVPGGRLVAALLVRPDLERIFEYRCRKLLELFALDATIPGQY